MRRLPELAAGAGALLLLAGCGGGSTSAGPTIAPAVVTPPRGAVVDARQWNDRDVALARRPGAATVQVVDNQGHGVDGLSVQINGRKAEPCQNGCYRAAAGDGPVRVRIGDSSWVFTIPATAPSGQALVRKAMAAYAKLSSARLLQRLTASDTIPPLVTRFVFEAPDRLKYANVGGSQGIVIGTRRWDRPSAGATWTESPQTRTRVMNLPWDRTIDAHVIAPNTVTFFDLTTRAWFQVVFDRPTSLPMTERMTGISHFMVDRYSGYNAPALIVPPRR